MKTPNWAELICASFGSIGSSRKYRVIWAPSRLEHINGKMKPAYPHLGQNWILEVLVPWEKFGTWNYAVFGPKTSEDGEYCHSHTISELKRADGGKDFLSLEDFGAETLRLLITCVERGKMIQAWQMKNHRDAMLEAEEKEARRIYSDVYDEHSGAGLVGGPLGENMTNLNPAKKRSDDHRIVTLEELTPAEQARYKCRPGAVKQIG